MRPRASEAPATRPPRAAVGPRADGRDGAAADRADDPASAGSPQTVGGSAGSRGTAREGTTAFGAPRAAPPPSPNPADREGAAPGLMGPMNSICSRPRRRPPCRTRGGASCTRRRATCALRMHPLQPASLGAPPAAVAAENPVSDPRAPRRPAAGRSCAEYDVGLAGSHTGDRVWLSAGQRSTSASSRLAFHQHVALLFLGPGRRVVPCRCTISAVFSPVLVQPSRAVYVCR